MEPATVWVNFRDKPKEQVEDDLLAWLAKGDPSGEAMSEQGHYAASLTVKRAYGMKVKKK